MRKHTSKLANRTAEGWQLLSPPLPWRGLQITKGGAWLYNNGRPKLLFLVHGCMIIAILNVRNRALGESWVGRAIQTTQENEKLNPWQPEHTHTAQKQSSNCERKKEPQGELKAHRTATWG